MWGQLRSPSCLVVTQRALSSHVPLSALVPLPPALVVTQNGIPKRSISLEDLKNNRKEVDH